MLLGSGCDGVAWVQDWRPDFACHGRWVAIRGHMLPRVLANMFMEDNRPGDARPESVSALPQKRRPRAPKSPAPRSPGTPTTLNAASAPKPAPEAVRVPGQPADAKPVIPGAENSPDQRPDREAGTGRNGPARGAKILLSSYMEAKSGSPPRSDEAFAILKSLPDMEKWGIRKSRTLKVVCSLREADLERSEKLARCGGQVALEYWIEHGSATVKTANWCNMPRLCQACAHARGIKLAKAAAEKAATVLNDDRDLRPWLVTFTVKNGPDLPERLGHLLGGFSAGWQRRKDAAKGKRRWSQFCTPAGSIFSAEIKRGRAGGWHPHLHCLWLVPASAWSWHEGKTGLQLEPDAHRQMCDEWHEITGDSYVINAKPLRTAVDMVSGEPVMEEFLVAELFELFKYLTKPGETSPADVVHAWQTTIGKRLVRSHGNLIGLQVPESLDDEPLSGDSWEVWFRWVQGRYQFTRSKFIERKESDDVGSKKAHADELEGWERERRSYVSAAFERAIGRRSSEGRDAVERVAALFG